MRLTIALSVFLAVVFLAVAGIVSTGYCQGSAMPGDETTSVSTDAVIEPGDDIVGTAETTMLGDPTSEGGDAANVINPGGSVEGKVQVLNENDGFVEIFRSGIVVERIPLIPMADGCFEARGTIGKVKVCGSTTTLSLVGRPDFNCAPGSGNLSEACEIVEPAS